MMIPLFIDLLLGLLLLGILSKNTSAYAIPFTSFGGNALLRLFQISWFLLLYGSIVLTINVLVGAGFIIIRNTIDPEASLLEILLILLVPNLVFYTIALLQSLSFVSLPYLSSSDKYITYLGQLAALLERTAPLLIGGLIVWRSTLI